MTATTLGLWISVVMLCVIIIACFLALFRTRVVQRPNEGAMWRNDDRFWSGGIIYNNSDDPELFVPRRSGWGWTVNFGHPSSRYLILGFVALLILSTVVLPLLVGGQHAYGCHPSTGCHFGP